MALSPFLSINIRNVGLLDQFFRQRAFQVIADYKTGSVAVCQNDQPLFLRQPAQKGQLFLIIEHAESAQSNNGGIHDLREGVFIIPSLYNNNFFDLSHFRCAPRRTKSSFNSPTLSMPRSLFIRRSNVWHIFTALAHQSAVVFFAADSSSFAG